MFDKQQHIAKFKNIEEKLVSSFKKSGINFQPNDGDLENVIFSKGDKEFKISHHSFYRYSGICSLYKEGDDKKLEVIYVTEEMYMNTFIKPIIENYFK